MDDTAQKNPQADASQQIPVQQPPPVVSHQPKVQPVISSGSAHKEHAPLSSATDHIRPAPHEAAPVIAEEVASHMEVAPNVEQPKVSDDHRKLGLQAAGPLLPAPTVLSDDKTLPLSAEQVTQSQSKQYSVWDSFKWYGKTVGRQMLRKLFLKNDR